jgi:DNA-binding transcriptional regulator of glucitol operon|tara:strand:- start:262 stop:471 length:210 start_codon:yes stop_codon:yes gene_type:complete
MKFRGYNNKSRVRQRREEAIERQKVHSGRSPEQQLKLIKTRPGESKKEKHRLVVKIEKAYKESNGIKDK